MLTLVQIPQLKGVLRLEMDRMGKLYEIIHFWETHEKMRMEIQLPPGKVEIEFVYAPETFLEYIEPGEKYGFYVGDMMFINSEIGEKHINWIPFILIKLYSERFVIDGLDQSGMVKHFESFYKALRLAGVIMKESEFREFLSVLVMHERTNYFDYDEELKKFIEDESGEFEDVLRKKKREYLDRHHGNKWVTLGRIDEELAREWGIATGFRNHAEAISQCIVNLGPEYVYLSTHFINRLLYLEVGEQLLIEPPFTAIAYMLTKDINKVVDLIHYVKTDGLDLKQEVIVKPQSKKTTWIALSKRMSYFIHYTEKRVWKTLAKQKKSFNKLLDQISHTNTKFEKQMDATQELIRTKSPFANVAEALSSLQGNYEDEMQRLELETERKVKNLRRNQDLAKLLEKAI